MNLNCELLEAVSAGDAEGVSRLLASGADANSTGTDSMTGLMLAVIRKNESVARTLLEAGADVNARDKNGNTVIAISLDKGGGACLALLLENGADVNLANRIGTVPLWFACEHLEWVTLLLEKGAQVNARGFDGCSPLFRAVGSILDKTDITELLIAHGADLNVKNDKGETALIWAARFGKINNVRLLLGKGANVDIVTNYNYTALKWAEEEKHAEIVALIRAAGKE